MYRIVQFNGASKRENAYLSVFFLKSIPSAIVRSAGAKNVEIKYTGLRNGEKLCEENSPVATVREYDYAGVCKDIDELIAISERYDDMATVKKMKQMVPEYKSCNSIYEKLDAAL